MNNNYNVCYKLGLKRWIFGLNNGSYKSSKYFKFTNYN